MGDVLYTFGLKDKFYRYSVQHQKQFHVDLHIYRLLRCMRRWYICNPHDADKSSDEDLPHVDITSPRYL